MAYSTPTQLRSVDPYSSYNSNNVNALTRVVSEGEDIICQGLDVALTTSTTLTVETGIAVKDDVMVHIQESMVIDLTDNDWFIEGSSASGDDTYYVVLDYRYSKISPAPIASIKILKTLANMSTGYYLFLKAIAVVSGEVVAVSDINGAYSRNIPKWAAGFNLEELLDVDIEGKADGSVIRYSTDDSKWLIGENLTELGDMNDVSLASQVTGSILSYTGDRWEVADSGNMVPELNDIANCDVDDANSGDFLIFNGSNWVNDSTSSTVQFIEFDLIGSTGLTNNLPDGWSNISFVAGKLIIDMPDSLNKIPGMVSAIKSSSNPITFGYNVEFPGNTWTIKTKEVGGIWKRIEINGLSASYNWHFVMHLTTVDFT